MKTIYKLDVDDIKTIIAQHFKVNVENVSVTTEKISVGYGTLEHDEYVPVVTVELK